MPHSIQQEDWNGVYYDRRAEDFYVMEVTENGVTLIDAFTGEEYETLGAEEFKDSARNGEFNKVSQHVVENPAEYAQNLLYDVATAVSGDATAVKNHQPVDVDFAITATNLSFDKDAPYNTTN